MFESIITALAGYALLALVFVLDKILVSQDAKKIPPPVVVFFSTATLLPVFVLLAFNVAIPTNYWQWLLALASGASFVGALSFMYYAFQESEVSHSAPVVGVATTIVTVIIANLFLSEVLSSAQFLGIFIIILGTLVLSFEKGTRHTGWHRGILYAGLAGVLFAISNTTAKYLYDALGFMGGLLASRGAIALAGLTLLFNSSVRDSIARGFHKHHKTRSRATSGFWALFLSDKFLGLAGVLLIQYALAIGSVSLVSALQGFQFALVIVGAYIVSVFAPKLFKELYSAGELRNEIIGVVLVALGMFLIF